MQRFFFGVAYFACLAGGFISVLMMIYYFFFMLGSAKPEKKRYVQLLGPLAFLTPGLFDEAGNRAKIKMLVFALLFAACFFGAMALLRSP